MKAFLKNLVNRFVKPQHIVDASDHDIKMIKYNDPTCQPEDGKIYLGMLTQSRQRKLLEDGDIAPRTVSKFFLDHSMNVLLPMPYPTFPWAMRFSLMFSLCMYRKYCRLTLPR